MCSITSLGKNVVDYSVKTLNRVSSLIIESVKPTPTPSKLAAPDTFFKPVKQGSSIQSLDFFNNVFSINKPTNENKPFSANSGVKNILLTSLSISDFINGGKINEKIPLKRINHHPESLMDGKLKIPSVKTSVNGVNVNISPKGLQQIMRCEEYVPPPGINIRDGAGVTVGYGHTKQGVKGMKIRNQQDAVNVLAEDVKISVQDKFRIIPSEVLARLNQDQLNALASSAMNLSSEGFKKFGPVKALMEKGKTIEQRIENAETAFMSGLRKGFSGLVWRRATEALTFSGTYVQNPGKESVNLAKQQDLIV